MRLAPSRVSQKPDIPAQREQAADTIVPPPLGFSVSVVVWGRGRTDGLQDMGSGLWMLLRGREGRATDGYLGGWDDE